MNLFQKIFGNKHTTSKEELKMTNIQKALELINTFASGDTERRIACSPKGISSTIWPTAPGAMPSSDRSNIWLRLPSKPR